MHVDSYLRMIPQIARIRAAIILGRRTNTDCGTEIELLIKYLIKKQKHTFKETYNNFNGFEPALLRMEAVQAL